jgi:hypothetical protein
VPKTSCGLGLVTWTNVLRLLEPSTDNLAADSQAPITGNTGSAAVVPWWDGVTARGASSQLSRPADVFGTHRVSSTSHSRQRNVPCDTATLASGHDGWARSPIRIVRKLR